MIVFGLKRDAPKICGNAAYRSFARTSYLTDNPSKVLIEIRSFLSGVVVLTQSDATADCYGKIRAALAKNGASIPENDIWIAATAMEHQLPLAARDQHFSLVSGLTVLS